MRYCLTHWVAAGQPFQLCFGKWLHTTLIADESSNERLMWLLLVGIMLWDFLVPSIANISQILIVALRMFPAFDEHTNRDIRENQNIQQVWRSVCGRRFSKLRTPDTYTQSQLSIKDVLVQSESREQMLTLLYRCLFVGSGMHCRGQRTSGWTMGVCGLHCFTASVSLCSSIVH